jgi:predicted DNA-binding transcriptional regulator AlpA
MSLLNELEVAKRVGVSPATLRRWRCTSVRRGPPFLRLNGANCVRYPEDELRTWLQAQRVRPEAA